MIAYDLNLLQQYKGSEGVKWLFDYFKKYMQDNYFSLFYTTDRDNNLVAGDFLKEMNPSSSLTNYFYYLVMGKYGINKLYTLLGEIKYDSSNKYDNVGYDRPGVASEVPVELFRNFVLFKINQITNWNLVTLTEMASSISGAPVNLISIDVLAIKQGEIDVQITVPSGYNSDLLKDLIENYNERFDFPLGYKITCVVGG